MTLTSTRRAGPLVAAAVVLLALAFATGLLVDRFGPFARSGGTVKPQPQLASDGYTPSRLDYREDHRLDAPAAGTDSLPYREDHRLDPRPAAPSAPSSTGTCRAGSVDCLPDDDLAGGNAPQPPAAAPAGNAAPTTGPCSGRDLALAGACGPAGGDAPRAPAAPAQSGVPPCLTADGALCGAPAADDADPHAAQQRQWPAWLDARDYGPAAAPSGGDVPICNDDEVVIGNQCVIP
ncbi:MAG TPA: hypothetical protein VFL91_10215 [Thermomicrobiales bacterium]|nr:hypothetical protein [Thermomicrobiales bacterium]